MADLSKPFSDVARQLRLLANQIEGLARPVATKDIEQAPRHEPEKTRRMLTTDEVLELIPVGKSTLKRMIKDGRFPRGNYITPNKRVWYEDTVLLWQRSLPAESQRRKAARRAAKRKG